MLAPLLVMAVPLYDTTSVILIRLREGRSPFQGDRRHFSHRLVARGLTPPQAVWTIDLVTLAGGLGALLLHRLDAWGAGLVMAQTACLLGVVAILELARGEPPDEARPEAGPEAIRREHDQRGARLRIPLAAAAAYPGTGPVTAAAGDPAGRAAGTRGWRIRRVAGAVRRPRDGPRLLAQRDRPEPGLGLGPGLGAGDADRGRGWGSPSSLIGGRFRFRWSWTDAAVVALDVPGRAELDTRARSPAGDQSGLGVGRAGVRLRAGAEPAPTRGESTVLAGALVATAVAVSAYGLFQARVEIPQLKARFQKNPRQVLLEAKIPADPSTCGVFADRLLGSNEVFSTFGLANSLAGFLVGPLVLAAGDADSQPGRLKAAGSRWGVIGLAAGAPALRSDLPDPDQEPQRLDRASRRPGRARLARAAKGPCAAACWEQGWPGWPWWSGSRPWGWPPAGLIARCSPNRRCRCVTAGSTGKAPGG